MMAITKLAYDNPSEALKMETAVDSSVDHKDKTIHSGHFMLSRVHEKDPQDDDDDYDEDDGVSRSSLSEFGGFNFTTANKEPTESYKFGTKSTLDIDETLNKLFKCMTLAYSGKLTSPKWKQFRGLHLTTKDKVRLNNLIWREWHMQYIYNKVPIICQFASPLSDDIHTKPEAIVLEGKYWKRRLDTVTAEYKKWRKFFKSRLRTDKTKPTFRTNAELLERVSSSSFGAHTSATDLLINATDLMDIDFNSDALFSSLNQPFVFPNPRDFSGVGVADLMQPGLISLQPTLDEYMDLGEPVQDFLPMSRSQNNVMQFTGNQGNDLTALLQGDPSAMSSHDMQISAPSADDLMQQPNNGGMFSNLLTGLLNNISSQGTIDTKTLSGNDNFVITQQSQKQHQPQVSFFLSDQNVQNTPKLTSDEMNQLLNVNDMGSKKKSLDTGKASSLHEALTKKNNNFSGQKSKVTTGAPPTGKVGKSHSAPAIVPLEKARTLQKREFAVPTGKPANTRMKQHRTIAPAISSSPKSSTSTTATPSQHNTYLAQLLTTGTYPGAIISVKKESTGLPDCPSPTSLPGLQAAAHTVQTTQPPIVVAPVLNKQLSELQQSVLITSPHTFGSSITGTIDLTSIESPGDKSSTVMSPSIATSPKVSESPKSLQESPMSFTLSSPSSKLEAALSPRSSFSPDSPARADGEGKDDQRRSSHITSEQKRRCNIKSGFDILHSLIPALSQNPNAKIAKAAMLQKTAEYCKKLKAERTQMQNEAEILKQEIESLNLQISQCQSQLPATGVPVTRQRADQMKTMFEEYVKSRTLQNWKFWIFSTVIRGLFDSYNYMVSTASMEELCRTTMAWLDQHCSLVALRPAVLNALRHLSTTTSILSDPSRMPEQANEAVIKGDKGLPSNT